MSEPREPPPRLASQVLLHVYTLGGGPSGSVHALHQLNKVTKDFARAGGAFHTAVEVLNIGDGLEWSFGATTYGSSGVSACRACTNAQHKYSETIVVGWTKATAVELDSILRQMTLQWPGDWYDVLRFNCCTFCDAFCVALGAGHLPGWVNRFGRIGAGGVDLLKQAASATKSSVLTVGRMGQVQMGHDDASRESGIVALSRIHPSPRLADQLRDQLKPSAGSDSRDRDTDIASNVSVSTMDAALSDAPSSSVAIPESTGLLTWPDAAMTEEDVVLGAQKVTIAVRSGKRGSWC